MRAGIIFVFVISVLLQQTHSRLPFEDGFRKAFDQDLYENVLDSDLCVRQMIHMLLNNQNLFLQFFDAGARIPRGVLTGSTVDLGNYNQCLEISAAFENDTTIDGKYCMVKIPLDQDLELPFEIPDFNFTNAIHYTPNMASEFFNLGQKPFYISREFSRSATSDLLAGIDFHLGICIPKVCTSQEWLRNLLLFNVSMIGFQIEEDYCRLPNDKPLVAADYVAIGVFGTLAIITILSTCYDINHTIIQKRDPKKASVLGRTFSVYTNTRRLTTFASNANALDCLDGIRTLSMLWVILGHAYSAYNFLGNTLDTIMFITSAKAIWISTGLFTVDSFFTMAGLLLVYTSVGKMNGKKLLTSLHSFYLNRLLRMFPLLAALVLLEASLFHHVSDGPYWNSVATNVQRCRSYWWATLLHIQNYVVPRNMCIQHSWYIAIDIQLHIISPIVLYWLLDNNQKSAWTALTSSILLFLVGSTIFNFLMDMPSTNMTITRLDEQDYYMKHYYVNTLTRAAPFFIGMTYGYILNLWKGKKVKINLVVVFAGWILALSLIGLSFYTSFIIMELDWDNQIGDNLFNSFMRAGWALGLGWIILACVKGYGGPINWFLSLNMWKLPARISYAMYLYHYPIQFVVTGSLLQPTYFTTGSKFFEFMAMVSITFIVAFAVTIIIDAPFSILIKMLMELTGGGRRRPIPQPAKNVTHTPENGISSVPEHPSVPEMEKGIPISPVKDGAIFSENGVDNKTKKENTLSTENGTTSIAENGSTPKEEEKGSTTVTSKI